MAAGGVPEVAGVLAEALAAEAGDAVEACCRMLPCGTCSHESETALEPASRILETELLTSLTDDH